MKKMIKRITNSMVMCTLAIGLLSGCGGEFAEEMTAGRDSAEPLTGSAVSGQAVSGQAVQPDDKEEGIRGGINGRYCSDHYYYEESYEYDGITQISLKTGKEKEFKIDGVDEVIYVEKDALYYTKEEDGDGDYYSLWRMPIECHADGTEELKTDQAEKVKGLDDIYYETDDIYMDDEYIVYSGAKGHMKTDVIRYDRKSGKKVSLPASKEIQNYLQRDIDAIYRHGNQLDFMLDGVIIRWDIGKGDVSVCADEDWEDEISVYTGDLSFYSIGWLEKGEKGEELGVACIDMDTKKKTEFVSEKEILDVLAGEAGIWKKQLEYVTVHSLYYDDNCLYIELEVVYEKGDTLYSCRIVLSRKNEEGSQIKYEKSLTEYMWDKGKEEEYDVNREDSGKESIRKIYRYGSCYGINQGMAYMVLSYDGDEEEDVIYDLKTGKVRPAGWEDELMFE